VHEVVRVLGARTQAGSLPGERRDGFRVALAIEVAVPMRHLCSVKVARKSPWLHAGARCLDRSVCQ
jgi:hypothetical protein